VIGALQKKESENEALRLVTSNKKKPETGANNLMVQPMQIRSARDDFPKKALNQRLTARFTPILRYQEERYLKSGHV
jgi:hypothetical protein